MALRARKRRRLIDVFFCGAQKEEQCHATGSQSQMNAHARPHRDHCPLYSSANPPVSVAAPAEVYMKRVSFCTNAIVAKRSRQSFATMGCFRWLLILSLVVSCDTAGGEPAAAAGSDVCTAGTGACEGQDGESAARIRAFQDWLDANQVSGKWQGQGERVDRAGR